MLSGHTGVTGRRPALDRESHLLLVLCEAATLVLYLIDALLRTLGACRHLL